jgi:acetyl esterase
MAEAAFDIPLDEGLPEFLAILRAVTAKLGPKPGVAAMREAGRAARLPLNAGGPVMSDTADIEVPTDRGTIAARLYRPSSGEAAPALVYLHGGGWVMLGLDTHDRLMREYAAASGWTVVALDYMLAPEAGFPHALEACTAAFRFLSGQAQRLGLDGHRLALGGDSSGANLAAAAAIALRDRNGPQPAGLLLNYGVYDSDLTRPSYAAYGAEPYQLTPQKMAFFWDCYCPALISRASPLAAPLRADLSALPPAYLTVAGQDILHDENMAFAEGLRAAGNTVTVDRYPGAPHAFLEAVAIAPVARQAVGRAAAWLRSIHPGRSG